MPVWTQNRYEQWTQQRKIPLWSCIGSLKIQTKDIKFYRWSKQEVRKIFHHVQTRGISTEWYKLIIFHMQAKTQAPPKNPWLSVQTFVLVVKFHSICRATEEYGTNHYIWNQFVLQSEYKWLALLGELLIWTQNISTTWTCLTSIFLSFWEPPFIKKKHVLFRKFTLFVLF